MHTIDLKNKGYRTDLVIDEITREKDTKLSSKILEKTKNVTVEEVIIDEKTNCNKKKGIYETISFTDITDKNNFKEVEELAIKTLKNMLNKLNISSNAKILVVGLGNASSTPDALGPKTLDHVLVTRHLFLLGDVEEGYRNVASFKPSVTGVTGIETKDLIEGIKEKIKPDILIVIDALASSSIERLNKTIQITSAGISPGSGVGNNRLEISQDTLHIPVIAIGVGLGNASSTPDALGPKTLDHVLVTRHLFLLGDVEEGYRNVASFKPSVTGVTGIETKDLIEGIKEKIKPDILIVIDALASSSIERLNKTIQITSAGISPGSGVGNNRLEISQDTLHIPVIAIGVPTVVDGATIVENTLQLLLKKISYGLENKENEKLKLVPITNQNYLNHTKELSKEQKEDLLGMVGLLDEQELKSLILEVLLPVNYNMMVTPKEIDYLIEKLSLLLGNMINKSLHEHFNPTN